MNTTRLFERLGSHGPRRLALLGVAAALSCSSPGSVSAPISERDASTGSPSPSTLSSGPGALAIAGQLAASEPELAKRLKPTVDGFNDGRDGVTSPGWRSAWVDRAYHVGARLPAKADEPFEAGVGVSDLYRMTIRQEGARGATIELHEGRVS
jgi:hypothetical protein